MTIYVIRVLVVWSLERLPMTHYTFFEHPNSYRVKLDIAPSAIVINTTLIFSREGENSRHDLRRKHFLHEIPTTPLCIVSCFNPFPCTRFFFFSIAEEHWMEPTPWSGQPRPKREVNRSLQAGNSPSTRQIHLRLARDFLGTPQEKRAHLGHSRRIQAPRG